MMALMLQLKVRSDIAHKMGCFVNAADRKDPIYYILRRELPKSERAFTKK